MAADEKKKEAPPPAAKPEKAPSSSDVGFALEPFKACGKFHAAGDLVEFPAEKFSELVAVGLVSRERPLGPGEIPMPPKGSTSCTVRLLGGMKRKGEHLMGGSLLEMPVPEYVELAKAGAVALVALAHGVRGSHRPPLFPGRARVVAVL
jgi:hypothetical protein